MRKKSQISIVKFVGLLETCRITLIINLRLEWHESCFSQSVVKIIWIWLQ